MRFTPHFVAGGDPYAGVNFVTRESKIAKADGTLVFRTEIVAPEAWSQTAVNMLAQKYMRRAGVPSATNQLVEPGVPRWLMASVPQAGCSFGGETDARQVFHRLAGCWTYWGWKLGYFDSEDDAKTFYNEHLRLMVMQMAAANSPQWFNTGLHWAYGISGDDVGRWAIDPADPAKVVRVNDTYSRPAAGACYIIGIDDNLVEPGGIMDFMTREARIFKGGGGSGAYYGEVRGTGEPLSGGGKSSGLPSFLKPIDRSAGSIKSGGTVRRAARMVVLPMDHPDIEWFVDWKAREEKKVAALVAGSKAVKGGVFAVYETAKAGKDKLSAAVTEALKSGVPAGTLDQAVRLAEQNLPGPEVEEFGTKFEGEAYETVSGQNANNSVRVTNAFMEAVDADAEWNLYWRTERRKAKAEGREPKPYKTLKARDLWDRVARAAWECADPGVQFHNIVNDWNTCLNDGEIEATNPCCLIGSTLVDTSEGRIRIDELAAASSAGRPLPYVFAYDTELGRPVLRKAVRAWKAGDAKRLVKIVTDKGVELVATPEHRFLTFSKGYKRADELRPGDSLKKVSRHANVRRSGRIMITDPGCGNDNGTEYQSVWMWEQVHGPIPDGYEVHHKNEDPTEDRLSNFELVERREHREHHSRGVGNPRFITVPDDLLLKVYGWLEADDPRQKKVLTVGRWNRAVKLMGLGGKVPFANPNNGGRIQGKSWQAFANYVTGLRLAANDRVVSVEAFTPDEPVAVYDLEVEGTHNFAVTSDSDRTSHSLVVHNSEFNWLPNSTCNLACLNLVALWVPGDWKKTVENIKQAARLLTIMLDVTVTMASYPSREVAEGGRDYRTIGLGYANLGGFLMRQGVAYDSDAGRGWAVALSGLIHFASAVTSTEIVYSLDTFPKLVANTEHVVRVTNNHVAYVTDQKYEGLSVVPQNPTGWLAYVEDTVRTELRELALAARTAVWENGLRNAQLTLVMPSGCLVAGSLVLTDIGLRRIGSLGQPDGPQWQDVAIQVQTDDGPRRATRFYVNGTDDVIRVRTKAGYTIRGTPRHRIRVLDRDNRWVWRRFADLAEGDRVPLRIGGMFGTPRRVDLPSLPPERNSSCGRGVRVPASMSPELAAFIGAFMGNGSLHNKGLRIDVTDDDPDMRRWCAETAADLFGVRVTYQKGTGKSTNVCVNSTQLREWWEAAGFAKHPPVAPSPAWVAHVPDAVLATNDPRVYAGFLRGLFSTDGAVGAGCPVVSNAKECFIDEVRTLLMALGVVTSTQVTVGELSGRPVWNLRAKTLRYARHFADFIGFIPVRKQRLLTTQNGDDRGDRVYVPREVEEAALPVGHERRGDLTRWRRSGGGVPRRHAASVAAIGCPDAGGRIATEYFYDQVVDAELIGRAPTYDLSVPDNVTYVADGFVSHNTVGLLMDVDTTGLEPDFALKKYKELAGGGNITLVNQAVGPALEALGYVGNDAKAVVDYVNKHGTVEGCDRLAPEHLAVFDCAVPAPGAKRSISPHGHLLMLAAVQPLLSGSASKTINLPPDATVADVRRVYTDAWRLGVKCVALYRDECKLSQPLSTKPHWMQAAAEAPKPAQQAVQPGALARGERRRPPGRRAGYGQKFRIGGHKIYLHTGQYEDGSLAEVFLTGHKEGAAFRSILAALAQAVSIALQYGAPLEEFVELFTHFRFEPNGPVSGHARIKNCTSFLDAVFRDLAVNYLGRDDLAHVTPPNGPTSNEPALPATRPATDGNAHGRDLIYTGEVCPGCGGLRMKRDGKCATCADCGSTTGCS